MEEFGRLGFAFGDEGDESTAFEETVGGLDEELGDAPVAEVGGIGEEEVVGIGVALAVGGEEEAAGVGVAAEVGEGGVAGGGGGVLVVDVELLFGEGGGEEEAIHSAAAAEVHHAVAGVEGDELCDDFGEGEAAHVGASVAEASGEGFEGDGVVAFEGDLEGGAVVGAFIGGEGLGDGADQEGEIFRFAELELGAGLAEALEEGGVELFGGNDDLREGALADELLEEPEVELGGAIAGGHLPEGGGAGTGVGGEVEPGFDGEAGGGALAPAGGVIFGEVAREGVGGVRVEGMEGDAALGLTAEPGGHCQRAGAATKEEGRHQRRGAELGEELDEGALGRVESAAGDDAEGFAEEEFLAGVRVAGEGEGEHGRSYSSRPSRQLTVDS